MNFAPGSDSTIKYLTGKTDSSVNSFSNLYKSPRRRVVSEYLEKAVTLEDENYHLTIKIYTYVYVSTMLVLIGRVDTFPRIGHKR